MASVLAYAPPTVPAFTDHAPAVGYGLPAPVPDPSTRNNLGVVALVSGITAVVLNIIGLIIQRILIHGYDGTSAYLEGLRTSSYIFAITVTLLALVAVICGAGGLALRGRGKAMAGIGLGIGIAVVAASIGGLITGSLVLS